MFKCSKSPCKRDTELAQSDIKCPQMIETQVDARVSKPRRNTLF